MKHKSQFTIGISVALLFLCPTQSGLARAKKSASPSPTAADSPTATATASPMLKAESSAAKERAIPFHGVISGVDTKAKTFTIASKEKSRVFKITNRSVLTKAGNPATMKNVVENEEVRGSYWKNTDGSLEAKSVKLGPLTEAEKAAQEARRTKRAEKKKAKEEAPATAATASPATSTAPSASPKP